MRVSIVIGLLLSLLLISSGLWFQDRQSSLEVCVMMCIDDPLTLEVECLSPCEDNLYAY